MKEVEITQEQLEQIKTSLQDYKDGHSPYKL